MEVGEGLLYTGTHEFDCFFEHPDCEVNLSDIFGSVLPTGNEVECRSSVDIVPKKDAFPGHSL